MIIARSGEEALELLAVQTVDCILLDLVMPGLSGQETCRRIKGDNAWRDLSGMARAIVAELESKDPGRTISVGIEDYVAVEADPRLARVALENLLGNAWKFTSKAPGARIVMGVSETADGPVVFICDNGAGFDMSHAQRLFSPFYRMHNDSQFPGIGMGLATVQRIVDRHGARIWADAAKGKGAPFFFTFSSPKSGRDVFIRS